MSYSLTIEFASTASKMEVTDWFEAVKITLPAGSDGTIKREETIYSAEDLTEDNIGDVVRFEQQHGAPVEGTLEAVFPLTKMGGNSRVLIVDGTAYPLTYGLVRVSDPVPVGV